MKGTLLDDALGMRYAAYRHWTRRALPPRCGSSARPYSVTREESAGCHGVVPVGHLAGVDEQLEAAGMWAVLQFGEGMRHGCPALTIVRDAKSENRLCYLRA